jgi:hypothetical protein
VRLGLRQHQPGRRGTDPRGAVGGERGLPPGVEQRGRGRVQRAAVARQDVAPQRADELLGVPGEDRGPLLRVVPERREGARRPPAADAELEPPAGQRRQHGGVLGDPQRRLERQRHDARAEHDPRGLRGGVGEQDERRGQAALVLVEVVLGHPRGVEADRLGRPDLLEGEAVAPVGARLVEHPGEEPEPRSWGAGGHGRAAFPR